MGERAKWLKRTRRQERRASVRQRIARAARALFSSGAPDWPSDDPRWDRPVGGVGVREPLHPRRPMLTGAVALPEPPPEQRDVDAIGGR